MIVGVLTVTLSIHESNSLKDKRQVVKSLLDGIRHRHNVAAAEVDDLDIWRSAVIGAASISNDRNVANSILNKVLEQIESEPRVEVTDVQMEFV